MIAIYIQTGFQGILTMVPFNKSGHNCFDRNSSLLEIRSYMINIIAKASNTIVLSGLYRYSVKIILFAVI